MTARHRFWELLDAGHGIFVDAGSTANMSGNKVVGGSVGVVLVSNGNTVASNQFFSNTSPIVVTGNNNSIEKNRIAHTTGNVASTSSAVRFPATLSVLT